MLGAAAIRCPSLLEALVHITWPPSQVLDVESWRLLGSEFPQDAHRIQRRVYEQALQVRIISPCVRCRIVCSSIPFFHKTFAIFNCLQTDTELVKNVQLQAISDEQQQTSENLFKVSSLTEPAPRKTFSLKIVLRLHRLSAPEMRVLSVCSWIRMGSSLTPT